MELHRLLYATISSFELEQRIARDDPHFDAWEYMTQRIGHKNPSTLRKMCQPQSVENKAKLGLIEAAIIMNETHDYRLLAWFVQDLKARSLVNGSVTSVYTRSCRSIDEALREKL